MVEDKLKAAGHSVTPWDPYKHPYAVDLANRTYAADGGTVRPPPPPPSPPNPWPTNDV